MFSRRKIIFADDSVIAKKNKMANISLEKIDFWFSPQVAYPDEMGELSVKTRSRISHAWVPLSNLTKITLPSPFPEFSVNVSVGWCSGDKRRVGFLVIATAMMVLLGTTTRRLSHKVHIYVPRVPGTVPLSVPSSELGPPTPSPVSETNKYRKYRTSAQPQMSCF